MIRGNDYSLINDCTRHKNLSRPSLNNVETPLCYIVAIKLNAKMFPTATWIIKWSITCLDVA